MHPIKHLNALVGGEMGQSLPPMFIEDNRADWSVEAAALWTLPASPPGSTDRADEVNARIDLWRQRDRNLAFAEFAVGFGRFIGHATTMAGKIALRPEERTGSSRPLPVGQSAAVIALISV